MSDTSDKSQPDTGEHDTTLGDIGENAALKAIIPLLPAGKYTQVGPGDDAALLKPMTGNVVLSTDTMFHGPDFRLAWSTATDLGTKIVTSNLADIFAMGATPQAMLIAIGAPENTRISFLEEFATAVNHSLAHMAPGVGVVGGDLTHTRDLSLAITVIGEQTQPPVRRNGADTGDRIAVWGRLGFAATGIRLLFDRAVDKESSPSKDLKEELVKSWPEVIQAQLAPTQDFHKLADILKDPGSRPTAMLDVSDGLIKDLRRISVASNRKMRLSMTGLYPLIEKLSTHSPYTLSQNINAILTGGEDHPLLATFAQDASIPEGFIEIGQVLEVGVGIEIDDQGLISSAEEYLEQSTHETDGYGWDAFQEWDGQLG